MGMIDGVWMVVVLSIIRICICWGLEVCHFELVNSDDTPELHRLLFVKI